MKNDNITLLGVIVCPNCKSEYVKVDLVSITDGFTVNHIDVYCQICKKFIRHMNVTPYSNDDTKLLNELNTELTKDS